MFLDHPAIFQRCSHMAGKLIWIRVFRINNERDFCGQRADCGILRALIGELPKPCVAVDETDCDAIGRRELARISIRRRLLQRQRLPQAMHRALANIANDGNNILCAHALARKFNRAIDIGLRHGSAGERLEGDAIRHPACSKPVEEVREIGRP